MEAGHKKDFLNEKDRIELIRFDNAKKGLDTSIGAVMEQFGKSMAVNFTPIIKDFTKVIDDNHVKIKEFFDNVGSVLASMAKTLGPIIATIADGIAGGVRDEVQFGKLQDFQNKAGLGGVLQMDRALEGLLGYKKPEVLDYVAASLTGDVGNVAKLSKESQAYSKAEASISEDASRWIDQTNGKVDLYLHIDHVHGTSTLNATAINGVKIFSNGMSPMQ